LVLLNGKRISSYGAPGDSSSVDVDSIPISAIERVEILKDGASAIYGSDAIAGVINFILRKDYTGAEITARTGQGQGGVGKSSAVNGAFGFGDIAKDRYNFMVVGSYQKDDAMFGRDSTFANSAYTPGINFGGSSRAYPANISIPGVGVRNPFASTAGCTQFLGGAYIPDLNPNICYFDTGPFVTLIPKTERIGLNGTGTFQLNESTELYGDLGIMKKTARTVIQASPIDAAFGIPFVLTPASQYYPTAFITNLTGGATPNVGVRYRPTFLTGSRDITDTATNNRAVAGLRGTFSGWDYDASFLYSASKVTEKLNGGYFRINDDATGPGIVPLLASGNVNPFGPSSAAVTDAALATNYIGKAFSSKTSITGFNGKASKELMQMSAGPLSLAMGVDLRREGYTLDTSAALQTGNISGYGGNFISFGVSRNVVAGYLELNAPITKSIEIDAALRFDSYAKVANPNNIADAIALLNIPGLTAANIGTSTTGSASSFSKATGKVGVRWQPAPEFLARGTLSTGYRAPSLSELYNPLQSGVTTPTSDPARCTGANFGNPSLKPETATNATIGFVLEPTKNLSVGAEIYWLRVKNLISAGLDVNFLLANEASYPGLIIRAPGDQISSKGPIIAVNETNLNTGKVYIQGIDLDAKWRIPAGEAGRFTLGVNASYMARWQGENPDGSYSSGIGTSSGVAPDYIPRLKQVWTLNWDRGPWTASLAYNWQSGYKDGCGALEDCNDDGTPASGRTVPAYETFDLQAAYSGFKSLKLAVGARNLLNRKPPFVVQNGGAFQSNYDPSYVDPRGRFIYFTGTYTFK
jgi:iron complex outermembrane receptor protein